MKTGYTITTRYSLDGTVEPTVEHSSKATELIQKSVLKTMEAQTERALTQFGWKPPRRRAAAPGAVLGNLQARRHG